MDRIINERLATLTAAGTSVWLDEIRRGLVEGGELERMVREDSLRGVTSNPAIFEKAILGSDEYDDQLEELTEDGRDARMIYRAIATRDVQEACDVLRPVYDKTKGFDGYVSLEVDPDLAHDTDKTITQAREYWGEVDRPNLMIKIPGTDAGVPAIETAIYEGINVNVTLLFAVEAYAKIAEAFVRGLERRLEEGKDVTRIHSVASFFVSRVDSEVDKRLERLGRTDLRGKAGLANARAAYQRYREIFEGERFAKLRAAGAPVQRPLWASTGVKDPAYSDTMYVDGLVAPNTVNTMPMATLLAAAEKTEVTGPTGTEDPTADLRALADAGIDMEDVTRKLLDDGIAKFVTPMEQLLAGIESKREGIVTGRPTTIESVLPEALEQPVGDAIARAQEQDVARRIWRKDDTLWGPKGQPEVANRLGWLTVTDVTRDALDDLTALATEVRDEGTTDIVVLGMGGSSLAPEVLRRSYGPQDGWPVLQVLDSTDAQAVRDLEARLGDKPLFVVSSKSGGTVETLSHFKHFHATVTDGSRFVAVTDPGSPLADLAKEHGFRRTFLNDPDIGGRYSALSFFGMVPAALAGLPVEQVLDRADIAREVCNHYDSSRNNSGLWLGVALGALAKAGRDKLTFVVDDPIGSIGLWLEQLVAESTGKNGTGILPVADEPLGDVAAYGSDRVFVHLKVGGADGHTDKLKDLADAGHPVITLNIEEDPADLGRIFFFAEYATAVAGWVLGINPFDQPNVAEAKEATKAVLAGDGGPGASAIVSVDQVLDELLVGGPPLFYALMGYLPPSDDVDAAVAELRTAIRAKTTATTTFGYGPRFLHSTGQLHKGGAKLGRFLQLVQTSEDLPVPGEDFTFERLKAAQAMGDLATLQQHGLPAWQLPVTGDPAAFIQDLATKVKER